MASKVTVLSQLEWLYDGLSGKSVTACLRLYAGGIAVLAAPAIVIGFAAGQRAAFQATVVLVAALVGAEYGLVWVVKSRARRLPRDVPRLAMKREEDLRLGHVGWVGVGMGATRTEASSSTFMPPGLAGALKNNQAYQQSGPPAMWGRVVAAAQTQRSDAGLTMLSRGQERQGSAGNMALVS